ncbi:NUDIX domain-containing protein [Streptomyces sp. BI20]|uniref:NUDIX domain-containing protein n=1 Tax=Streptomyces sp. BI20 TaxID=3403460 RepID=UPI003C72D292
MRGERVEWVDAEGRVLGTVDRARAARERRPVRIASAICRDAGGRVLVARRAEGVRRYPGSWQLALGGAAGVGEAGAAAVVRELAEELGAAAVRGAAPVPLGAVFVALDPFGPFRAELFEVSLSGPVRADPAEVAEVRWSTPAEVAARVPGEPGAWTPETGAVLARWRAAGPRSRP